jgi:hypothetical protein
LALRPTEETTGKGKGKKGKYKGRQQRQWERRDRQQRSAVQRRPAAADSPAPAPLRENAAPPPVVAIADAPALRPSLPRDQALRVASPAPRRDDRPHQRPAPGTPYPSASPARRVTFSPGRQGGASPSPARPLGARGWSPGPVRAPVTLRARDGDRNQRSPRGRE